MKTGRATLGTVEVVSLAGLGLVALVVGTAVAEGFTVALVPGLIYVFAISALYLGYRYRLAFPYRMANGSPIHPASWSGASVQRSDTAELSEKTEPVTFRVVGTRGVCPLGHGKGMSFEVDPSGTVQPHLCAPAEAVLCSTALEGNGVREWCCPIYDHYLVFRRETVAA